MRGAAQLFADARQGWRAIQSRTAMSAVIVLSLAVAIAANVVVFSWIQARVLKPLPGIRNAGSYYLIEPRTEAGLYPGFSWLEYLDVRDAVEGAMGLIASRSQPLYIGASGETERVPGQLISDNYFSELGVSPFAGRLIGPAESLAGAREPVAVISYGMWQSRFNGGPLDGRTLRINGQQVPVIGVTPPDFKGAILGLYFDVWLPATSAPVIINGSRELTQRGARGYQALGRLRPDMSQSEAQARVSATMSALEATYPLTNRGMGAVVLSLRNSPRGPQRTIGMLLLLQTVMMVLLVAVCGNVANLLLARASARRREAGIRLALGASRWRIVSLIITEGLILALAGAILGALFAVWATRAFLTLPITTLPIRFETSVDASGLGIAMGLGILAGLLASMAPALQLSRTSPQRALREGLRETGRNRLRESLLAVQSAFGVYILIIAGLFIHSFIDTRVSDPGFKMDGVLLASFDLRGRRAGDEASLLFARRLLERVRTEPAVASAALSSSVPLDIHGLPLRAFEVDGRVRDDDMPDQSSANTVSDGYFATLGIPFVAGRDFAALNDADAPPQAVVNQVFVDRYLAGLEPLGRRLQARGQAFTIVGVVANTVSNAFGEPSTPVLYLSYRDNPLPLGEINVRLASGDAVAGAPDIRRIAREIDPELPVFNVRTLAAHVDSNLMLRLIPARIFSVIGPLMLALIVLGIYATVAYTAALRTKEIGIRLALGATGRRLILGFVREHMQAVVVGTAAGWLIAWATVWGRATAVADPEMAFAAVPVCLLSAAALACWLPVFRASRVPASHLLRQG